MRIVSAGSALNALLAYMIEEGTPETMHRFDAESGARTIEIDSDAYDEWAKRTGYGDPGDVRMVVGEAVDRDGRRVTVLSTVARRDVPL